MSRPTTLIVAIACCIPLLLSAAPRYSVNPLWNDIISVTQINSDGEVAGNYMLDRDPFFLQLPFWTNGYTPGNGLSDLASYGTVTLTAINDTQGVTGRLLPAGPGAPYAFAKPAGEGPLVPILPGAGMGYLQPTSISNERQAPYLYVAGDASMTAGGTQAFRWAMTGAMAGDGTMLALGTLGGAASHASDVNRAGQVTGWANTARQEEAESAGGLIVAAFQIAIASGAVFGGLLVDGFGTLGVIAYATVATLVGGAGVLLLGSRSPERVGASAAAHAL